MLSSFQFYPQATQNGTGILSNSKGRHIVNYSVYVQLYSYICITIIVFVRKLIMSYRMMYSSSESSAGGGNSMLKEYLFPGQPLLACRFPVSSTVSIQTCCPEPPVGSCCVLCFYSLFHAAPPPPPVFVHPECLTFCSVTTSPSFRLSCWFLHL